MPKNGRKMAEIAESSKMKNNCSLFSSTFHVKRPVSGYACLKLKFLCKRYSPCILFNWIDKVEFQNTCKKSWTEKCLKYPTYAIFFKRSLSLGVQGCQIWHSHVLIPFNSAPAPPTRPHNAKKALYAIISAEIPENLVHKSCCLKH